MAAARRFEVFGRVQGVGYRFFVWRRASELGLRGWVRNRPDGSVEVLAGGEPELLDELGQQLARGPRWARVDRLEVSEAEVASVPAENGFGVRRD